MTVFDLFSETSYQVLKIHRSTTFGNKIVEVLGGRSGVFKKKSGVKRGLGGESWGERSVLFVRPEDFYFDPIGNGVRIGGLDYQIVAMSEGANYDTGEVEHLKLALERAEFYAESEN